MDDEIWCIPIRPKTTVTDAEIQQATAIRFVPEQIVCVKSFFKDKS